MLCYMDRAWCSESHVCGTTDCDRHLSEQEAERATRIRLPISFSPFNRTCGKQTPVKGDFVR